MSTIPANRGCPQRRFTAWGRVALPFCVLCLWTVGCGTIERPVVSATPPGLNWLANLVPTNSPASPPVVLESIKPAETPAAFSNGDLLEVTVWDLNELGKPEVIPCRVDPDGVITLPLYGHLSVEQMTQDEINERIAEAYKSAELLLEPRILTRPLEFATVEVSVMGAVKRPGQVKLSRNEASVFQALVSAGGLDKSAGTHLQIYHQPPTRALAAESTDLPSPKRPELRVNQMTVKPVTLSENEALAETESHPPEQMDLSPAERSAARFASLLGPELLANADTSTEAELADTDESDRDESVAVEAGSLETSDDNAEPVRMASLPAEPGPEPPPMHSSKTVEWFDLSRIEDQARLREIHLQQGDIITVKTVARPVKISGSVVRPGAYNLPTGNALSIWEAALLAGGLTEARTVHVTLARPARDDQEAHRWAFTLEPAQSLGVNMPFVQPGDQLHFETTARSRLEQALDKWSLWKSRGDTE